MNTLTKIIRIALFELRNVVHDGGVLLFVLFMPLGYPLIYALIYTNEVVYDVPTVVWDEDDTPSSRALIRHIDATREARVAARVSSEAEAKAHLADEAFCMVHIPADFSRRVARGEQATVGLLADMGSMMYYKSLMSALGGAAAAINRPLLVARHLPAPTERETLVAAAPVECDAVALYNPTGGFAAFLVPPVLMLIIQQSMMLGVGMAAGCLRQRWQKRLVPSPLRGQCPVAIVMGRAVVYFGIYLLMALYMTVGVTRWFGLPQLAHYGTLVTFLVPYVLACVFFSLTCSGFVYRREDCIMLFVFFSAPLLFLSGISWPGAAMPTFWRVVSALFPSSFGINAYVRIAGAGASVADVACELRALWVQVAVYGGAACWLYRHDERNDAVGRRKTRPADTR